MKRIQLNQAFGAVLVVVLVAVLVIISLFIFEALSTSFTTDTITVTNETGAFVNATGYTVDNAGVCDFGGFSVTQILNDTDGSLIPAVNYTATAAGVITNATVVTYANASVSYSYTWGASSCTASNDMIDQFATYPALVGLVGTIVFLGLVIGILVASFVFGGSGRKI